MEQRNDAGTGTDAKQEEEMRRRVRAASPGEPAAGLEAESGDRSADQSADQSADRPESDQVTEEDREAQTREAERVQQSGEGMRGYGTGGREDYGSEDEIRRTAETGE